ncbi:hypothetical protein NT239_05235 [Chitinibacter sp. SCUT-21]|uniref:hypothetical protein n=1 Tax=Chitinibacter sp. SCUT-21 TaxID=2970891 RepID=UPI0035A735BA
MSERENAAKKEATEDCEIEVFWLWLKEGDRLIYTLVCLAVLLMILFAAGYYFGLVKEIPANLPIEKAREALGQLGDFFGGVLNPLFSALTIFLLLRSISQQDKQLKISSNALEVSANELALSREELSLTRDELRKSADAQTQSEIALRTQAEAAIRTADINTSTSLLNFYAKLASENTESINRLEKRVEILRFQLSRDKEKISKLEMAIANAKSLVSTSDTEAQVLIFKESIEEYERELTPLEKELKLARSREVDLIDRMNKLGVEMDNVYAQHLNISIAKVD